MKAWAIGVLAAALFGAAVGTPSCFAAEEEPVDGGTTDNSIRHESPVVISSRDISSFSLQFEFNGAYGDDGLRVKYPPGNYGFRLERTAEGAKCHIEYGTEEDTRAADFTTDESALSRLDELLKARDVAQIDGHAKYNSALGGNMRLDVLYESGEKIFAIGEGGASVVPDSRYYQPEWFIDFFRALGHEYGQGDPLGPRLKRCSYKKGGGMEGRFYELELSLQKDGSARLTVDFLPRNGAESQWREYDLPGETLDELEAMLNRGDLADWGKAPMSEIQALDADTASVSFDYANGHGVTLADTHDIPREGFAVMKKVKEFLEALDTDAPGK